MSVVLLSKPHRLRTRRFRFVAAGLAVALAAAAVVAVSSPAAAQQGDDGEVRIVARRHANGRVEFGLQQRTTTGAWGERQLPRTRFLPTTAPLGRWLSSSPLTVTAGEVRIVARRHADGRVEFGLQQRTTTGAWGERQLPRTRFLPTTAPLGRWLSSSPLTPGATPTPTTTPTQQNSSTLVGGGGHLCGLRTDATITCWGSNYHGQADAPDGRFSAIAAGASTSCGVRTDGTITCWGRNDHGQADAPDGRFSAIAAGTDHSCGVRTDGTITCWGLNDYGQADAPDGRFSAVAAGRWHSCGLRTDGTITCWGYNRYGQADAPDGRFSAVDVGKTIRVGSAPTASPAGERGPTS